MMRSHILVSATLSLTLTACGSVTDAYMVDSLTKEKTDYVLNGGKTPGNDQYVPSPIDIYTTPFPGDPNPANLAAPSVTPAAIGCAATEPNDPRYYTSGKQEDNALPKQKGDNSIKQKDSAPEKSQAKQECRSAYAYAISDTTDTKTRDGLMSYLIEQSDKICHVHEAGIIATGHEANFTLSEGATVLGGLGALFTPAATVRVLSGSAAIVNATRDNFNQVFYQNLLAPAIVKAIESARSQKRAALFGHVGKDKDTYTVDQMLADVEDFHSSCSFYVGLVALTNAASRVTASTDEISARINTLMNERKTDSDRLKELTDSSASLKDNKKQNDANEANIAMLRSGMAQLDAQILQLQNQLAFVPSAGGAPAVAVAPAPAPEPQNQ